jgi:uncharacterized membrane protein
MRTRATGAKPSAGTAAARFWTSDRVGQLVRSAALMATVGASIVLFVHEVAQPADKLDAFLAKNELILAVRNRLLLAMAAAATVLLLSAGTLVIWRRTESTIARVRRAALIASPLTLLGVMPPLLKLHPWQSDPMLLGCAVAVVILILEQTVWRSLESIPDGVWRWLQSQIARIGSAATRVLLLLPISLVVAGALAYGVFVTILTIRYHNRLGTAAFDLGSLDNIFYNTLRGHPLRGTVQIPTGGNWSDLRVHAEFSTYVLLPFYALRPRAETLLCVQAFIVGLGAVPVYLLAARRLPRISALLLAAAYLLFAPVHSGNFYDVHFQPFASTLILWCFYFLDARKNILFAVFFVIALGCREDASISLAVAGVILLATGFRPLAGFVIALTSGLYFVIVRFVVMPRFGTWWFNDMYKDLEPGGDASLLGVIKTVVSNPLYTLGTLLTRDKFLHVLQIFLPLAFLPLRRPWLWLGFVPAILGTILTTGYHPTTDTTFQYVFYWVPFIFAGAALVLEQIRERQGHTRHAAAVVAMVGATLLTSFHWGAVFQRETFASAWGRINLAPLTDAERQTLSDLREVGDMVPKDASLAVSEMETAHFSNRLTVYTLKLGVSDADYVLYRTDSGGFGSNQASEALASGKYERVAERGKFALLKRAAPR